MKAYGNNILISADFSGDYRPGFGLENLITPNLFPPYRSETDTTIMVIDLGVATKFDYFAIGAHNFTSGVDITLEYNSINAWVTPAGSMTIDYAAGNIVKEFTELNYRYLRLVIDDTGNPDTYIQMGKLSAGSAYAMPDVEPGFDLPIAGRSTVATSPTGQVYGTTGVSLIGFNVNIITASKATVDTFNTFYELNQNVIPFFIAIYPESLDKYPLLHCRIVSNVIQWRHEQDGNYSTVINMEEVR